MKNKNLLVILAILIIPLVLYLVTGVRNANSDSLSFASCSKPVVLDFSSPMCMECGELAKVLGPLEVQYKDKIDFRKISANSSDKKTQELVKKYKVNVVPTLVFLDKNGKVVRRTEGSMPSAQLKKYLDELVNG